MKRKKAALYDPFLETMGGGERHILAVMKVLEESGYHVSVFWNRDLRKEISSSLNITFDSVSFITNIFTPGVSRQDRQAVLKDFDIFIYVTDGSYFFSSAAHTFVFCMVPDRSLYQMNILNRIKTRAFDYISNSRFTQSHLNEWGIHSDVLYPYVDDDFIAMRVKTMNKDTVILSVGRFFSHLHSKKHDVSIQLFKQMKTARPKFKDFKLVLAGGLKDEDKPYYNSLIKLADGDPTIEFAPNISYTDLKRLYKRASIYWHMAGYGVDDTVHPERVEHFGITPLEAMAAGCIPFCYAAGGPKEIIKDGENGFLFHDEAELMRKMDNLPAEKQELERLRVQGHAYVARSFSKQVFADRVRKLFITQ